MQAKHGSGSWGRRRSHLIGCAIGLAALFALAIPSFASAQPTETYVGLGNSLAFGFSSQLYHHGEALGFEDPEGFDHGYVDDYLVALNKANTVANNGKKFRLRNDGCPGETTETMIGENATMIATLNAVLGPSQAAHELPPVKGSNSSNPPEQDKFPCEYQAAWNAFHVVGKGGPLHHPYPGSQLEDAIALIATSAKEGKPVTAVTLDIGLNDALHFVKGVEKETKEVFVPTYIGEHEPTLKEEAKTEAGEQYFKHKSKYDTEGGEAAFKKCSEKAAAENVAESREPFAEPFFKEKREACLAEHGSEFAAEAIEAKLAAYGKRAYEFKVGAAAEAHAAEKIKEGIPGVFKQINSNLQGILLAIRRAGELGLEGNGVKGINYGGKILFLGGYNAFGKLFRFAFEGVGFVAGLSSAKPKVEGESAEYKEIRESEEKEKAAYAKVSGRCAVHASKLELEEEAIEGGCTAAAVAIGFNGLVGILNGSEEDSATAFGACMSAPLIVFNPQKETEQGKLEAERLKKFTGMANASREEVPVKSSKQNRYNGPDIHPTATGYKQLQLQMTKETTHRCHTQGFPGF